jgi:alpha-mannosidase
MKVPADSQRIVHVVLNAHIDPAWLWPWQAGLDEALATCRSACDRLEANPDAVFTRGEAWVHRQVEQCDPALFERIRRFVAEGRWHIVGGWWIQPDCNGPSAWAMDRQAEIGLRYFEGAFGFRPRTAYNVDSFGHAAYLPSLMRSHGQDRYVMMRPGDSEMTLPAHVFRWRGYADGPEVTVFRIAGGYCTGESTIEHVEQSLADLPPGCRHTMCFAGAGDHGGGPTERQIAWFREHRDAIPGVRLEFSDPDRFFDAVAAEGVELPLVVGELQHHAVGCYSVCHGLKVGARRAEHMLRQAERVSDTAALVPAWERVAFTHFHDIYGGTCIPSAYPQIEDQLGFARSAADDALQLALRRRLPELPDDPAQRVVLLNASDRGFAGYVEFEPWMEVGSSALAAIDEGGIPVPVQVMPPEASLLSVPRMLFHLEVPPGGLRVLRLQAREGDAKPALSEAEGSSPKSQAREGDASSSPKSSGPQCSAAQDGVLRNNECVKVDATTLHFNDDAMPKPRLQLIEDFSDTWSHEIDRYGEEPCAEAAWDAPSVVDAGPLLASATQSGRIGESRLKAEWRVYAGEPFAELRLTIHWLEARKVLKMVLPVPQPEGTRIDGVMGGVLERRNDGAERPLRDLTSVGGVCVVCPEVFALDGTPERLRLTLLRSAIMAHHLPRDGSGPRAIVSDQGEHTFRFRFYAPGTPVHRLDADAFSMQRPLVIADLTRGMGKGPGLGV